MTNEDKLMHIRCKGKTLYFKKSNEKFVSNGKHDFIIFDDPLCPPVKLKLHQAIIKAINDIGLSVFKKCSMFMSNRKTP